MQLKGLQKGLNKFSNEFFTIPQLYLINSDGQLSELVDVLKKNIWDLKEKSIITKLIQIFKKDENYYENITPLKLLLKGHCTAIFKLVKDQNRSIIILISLKYFFKDNIADILVSHSTWDDYTSMYRTYKL